MNQDTRTPTVYPRRVSGESAVVDENDDLSPRLFHSNVTGVGKSYFRLIYISECETSGETK